MPRLSLPNHRWAHTHFVGFVVSWLILPVSDTPLKMIGAFLLSCNKAFVLLKPCFNLLFSQLTVVSVSFAVTGSDVMQWLSCCPNIAMVAGSVLGLSNESTNRGLVSTT